MAIASILAMMHPRVASSSPEATRLISKHQLVPLARSKSPSTLSPDVGMMHLVMPSKLVQKIPASAQPHRGFRICKHFQSGLKVLKEMSRLTSNLLVHMDVVPVSLWCEAFTDYFETFSEALSSHFSSSEYMEPCKSTGG